MKRCVERRRLQSDETYLARLQTACQSITVENCQGYIRHCKSFWLETLRQVSI